MVPDGVIPHVIPHTSLIALKCKTLGGILRCRLWMQTNALSRHKMQVALLVEPKTPLESSVFMHSDHVCAIIAHSLMSTSNEMCGGFFASSTAMRLHCICSDPLHMRV